MTNQTLITLDISKNNSGNDLAIAITKIIHTNRTLKTISMDENGISHFGFQAIKHALERNNVLTSLNSDVDIAACIRLDKIQVHFFLTLGDLSRRWRFFEISKRS